jgi:hypothetical protein
MKKLLLLIIFNFQLTIFNCSAQVSLSIIDFGAVNDGTTINTTAIQSAIDSCFNAGGGEVHVPEGGTFLSGTIFLRSNVLLHLDSAAILKGSGNPAHYPEIESQVHGMADEYRKRSLIYAEGENNIGIIGKGTLDGNSFASAFILNSSQRAFGVRFISCVNVRYEDISMKNSSFWMMHNLNCDTLLMSGLKINNSGVGNNDGIAFDGCRYVRIHDCTVESFDDAMVMKTTSTHNLYDVEVYNCTFSSLARVIKIGTETVGNINKIHIHDCVVSEGGLGQPGEIGINVASIDGAHIDSVLIENITVSGVQVPIVVRLGDSNRQYVDSLPPLPAGTFKNLVLRNISGEGLNNLPCHITGISDHSLENVHLENISFTVPGGSATVDSNYVVPENIEERPEMDLFGNTLPAYGIYFRHVNGLTLDSVCFTPLQSDARAMLWIDDVQNMTFNDVCQPPVFGAIEDNNLQNSLHLIYNPQSSLLEIKNAERGRLNVYRIDGRLLLSEEVNSTEAFYTCAAFPFAWKFESVKGNLRTGKIWLKN